MVNEILYSINKYKEQKKAISYYLNNHLTSFMEFEWHEKEWGNLSVDINESTNQFLVEINNSVDRSIDLSGVFLSAETYTNLYLVPAFKQENISETKIYEVYFYHYYILIKQKYLQPMLFDDTILSTVKSCLLSAFSEKKLKSGANGESIDYFIIKLYNFWITGLVLNNTLAIDISEKGILRAMNYENKIVYERNEMLNEEIKSREKTILQLSDQISIRGKIIDKVEKEVVKTAKDVRNFKKEVFVIMALLVASFSIIGINISVLSKQIDLNTIILINISMIFSIAILFLLQAILFESDYKRIGLLFTLLLIIGGIGYWFISNNYVVV